MLATRYFGHPNPYLVADNLCSSLQGRCAVWTFVVIIIVKYCGLLCVFRVHDTTIYVLQIPQLIYWININSFRIMSLLKFDIITLIWIDMLCTTFILFTAETRYSCAGCQHVFRKAYNLMVTNVYVLHQWNL